MGVFEDMEAGPFHISGVPLVVFRNSSRHHTESFKHKTLNPTQDDIDSIQSNIDEENILMLARVFPDPSTRRLSYTYG